MPPPAEGGQAWKHRVKRPGRAARRVEHDLLSGLVALVVENDEGDIENLDHGLVSGGSMSELVNSTRPPTVRTVRDSMDTADFAGRMVGTNRGADPNVE